jgi:hypothetical protein
VAGGTERGRSTSSFNHHNFDKNFQEEIPVKLKMLVVLSVIAICCVGAQAKVKSYTFGLETSSGGGEYCNYLSWSTAGTNNSLAFGTDNLTAACGSAQDATIVGEKGTLSALSGLPAAKGFAMATNENDEYTASNSGYTAQYIAGTLAGQTWVVLIGSAPSVGDFFSYNYGTLSSSIPSGKTPTRGAAASIK